MFDCENYYSSESDCESWPPSNLYDRFQPSCGYHAIPLPYIGAFMPHKPDLVFNIAPTAVETDHLAFNVQLSPTKTKQDLSHTTRPCAPIIEDWVSDSVEESETKSPQFVPSFARSSKHVKTPRYYVQQIKTNIPAATPVLSKPVSNTAVRPVSAALPNITVTRPRHAHQVVTMFKSPIRRHITRSPSSRNSNSPPRVNAVKVPMFSAVQGMQGTWGIKREFSVPRTPQQNGIAKKKNQTLIKAARTMLADLLLPIPFWAKAVNTACYVQNRVLVTKPHNKTPYEILHGRTPSIDFIRPFSCPVTILNTLDPLGKFQGKVDIGFLVGYSICSKAFREHDFDVKKPESKVILSPSCSTQSKEQDDKTKKEAKGKSPIESVT
nr:ribonuclease H-like domain-containing protein [Tanacetum cinerariifolium]